MFPDGFTVFPRILIEYESQCAPKEWTILKTNIHVKLIEINGFSISFEYLISKTI